MFFKQKAWKTKSTHNPPKMLWEALDADQNGRSEHLSFFSQTIHEKLVANISCDRRAIDSYRRDVYAMMVIEI